LHTGKVPVVIIAAGDMMLTKVRGVLSSRQPFRVIGKSVRNLFFPSAEDMDRLRKTLQIEVSSFCSARCVFCAYKYGRRRRGKMSFEVFGDVVRSAVSSGMENLDMTPLTGDLFTHERAVEMITAARQAGIRRIEAYTNGILLHRHDMARLVTSGIDPLYISFPGFEERQFEEIFGVRRFGEFKMSVDSLLAAHRDARSAMRIIFEPRTYLTHEQLIESEFFRDYLSRHISEVVKVEAGVKVFDSWAGTIRNGDLPGGMKVDLNPVKSIYPVKKVFLCQRLLTVGVLANGDVRLCNCRCDESIETETDSLFIANIKDYESFHSLIIENSGRIAKLRSDFIRGKLPVICRKCPFYAPVVFDEIRE
jgi:Radical SAM superfamily